MAPRNKLECPSCGAPLRWKGVAPVVACRYCDTHVHTPSGQVTHEPAVIRSQGKASGGCGVVAFILGINLLVGGIALVVSLATEGVGKLTGVPMERLAALDIGSDNAAVALALGLAADEEGDDLYVPLRGNGFDYAVLQWPDAHPERVSSFYFYASEGNPDIAAVLASLEHSLGRRLEADREGDGTRYWRWAGAHINISTDGTHMGFSVDPEDDPHWAYRAELLWSVALAAAQGQALELQPDTRKAWLAHGYPISALAQLDLRYEVDGARAYVPATFPGAHEEIFIDLDFTIPLDHLWFGEVELSWANEAGGALEDASLHPVPGLQHLADQDAVQRCLDQALGRGERRVQDHLAGTWSAGWELRDGTWLNLSQYGLDIHLDGWNGEGKDKSASWRRIVAALDGCGN
jgi:hypothetical protein